MNKPHVQINEVRTLVGIKVLFLINRGQDLSVVASNNNSRPERLRVPNQGLNRSTDEPALGQGTEEGAATVTGQQHVPINKPIIQHYINNGMVQGDNILRELHKQELKENSLLTKEKLNSNKGKTEVINQEPTVPGTQTQW